MIYKNRELDIAYLKELSYEELSEVCFSLRKEIIRIVSNNGGHLSSNLGVVELEIALVRFFDFPKDKLLIDVGHQSYTYKIITGRNMDTLRKRNGVSGFQKREESIYDVFEAGHSSTSLSAALGMATTRDLQKDHYEVVALIGDASIMNGMALEALNDIGSRKHKVIIVLNDNDMSVSKTVGALHNYTDEKSVYRDFGLEYIGPIDGHNIEELENAFQMAKNSMRSIVIHTYTEKGKGYSFAEDDTLGAYHGISPFKVRTGIPIKDHPNQVSYSSFFGNLVDKEMGKNKKITLICPAMTLGCGLQNSFLKYHHRCFDVGIAEEHSVTLAAGMALGGYKPILCIYSTFLQRAFDQVSHDVARMNLPVLFLIDRSGLVGEDGETHQGLYDEAFLLNTPNMVVTVPSDMATSVALFQLGISYNSGPFAIRYPRGYYMEDDEEQNINLEFGKWRKETSGDDCISIIACGDIVPRLKKLLAKENISVHLYNALFLKPFDTAMLEDAMKAKNIFLIDIMATKNGFVSEIVCYLSEHHYKGDVRTYAVKDEFIKQGTLKEQLKDNGLDDETLLNEIKIVYEKNRLKV